MRQFSIAAQNLKSVISVCIDALEKNTKSQREDGGSADRASVMHGAAVLWTNTCYVSEQHSVGRNEGKRKVLPEPNYE